MMRLGEHTLPPPTTACAAAVNEREQVDAATADVAVRIRRGALGVLSCREAEELLDGNFKVNDEIVGTFQKAWESTLTADCKLSETARPEDARNKALQELAVGRTETLKDKADLDVMLLEAKLYCQEAAVTPNKPLNGKILAAVLEANLAFRRKCVWLGIQCEALLHSASQQLREVGERSGGGSAEEGADRIERRWRAEFETIRDANDKLLKSLRNANAARGVPSWSLEERIDDNWRFLLELVGLLEKVVDERQVQAASKKEDEDDKGSARSAKAKDLLVELEEQLPCLLECKYLGQEAAAQELAPDVASVERCITAAQAVQAAVWKFVKAHDVDLSNICLTKFAEEMLPHPAAFGQATVLEGNSRVLFDGFPPVIRALTYNIFMRAPAPSFAHNTGDDKKDERLTRFVAQLEKYDVVCLQEAFGVFSQRRDWLVAAAMSMGFHDDHRSPTNVFPRFLIDGGLLILSRLPILRKATLTFERGVVLDSLSAKGALYVKLQCGADGPYLHVCTTHLQSTYTEESRGSSTDIRLSQLAQLVEFLQRETDDGEEGVVGGRRWPLLLCGTLNFNGRKSAMDGAHSREYISVMEVLSSLGEVRDLLYDIRGSHPVTYADTRFIGNGDEVPVERILTTPTVYENETFKRQCLDYMLFFPHQAQSAGKQSSDNEKVAFGTRSDVEPLVPSTCQVEKFLVDRAQDVGAPITQLSDHYGIEATLTVVAGSWGCDSTPGADCARTASLEETRHAEPPHDIRAVPGRQIIVHEDVEDDNEEDWEKPIFSSCVFSAGASVAAAAAVSPETKSDSHAETVTPSVAGTQACPSSALASAEQPAVSSSSISENHHSMEENEKTKKKMEEEEERKREEVEKEQQEAARRASPSHLSGASLLSGTEDGASVLAADVKRAEQTLCKPAPEYSPCSESASPRMWQPVTLGAADDEDEEEDEGDQSTKRSVDGPGSSSAAQPTRLADPGCLEGRSGWNAFCS
eukprot:TRINITY_DN31111_c0_g1_i1.p1 TRINITY_DN31111_c0_g1~~TRINITY_DN31111_c0_g1_i1.p1  ORF type:complete len:981 (-),score=240.04 TRINITY_DN31111_c0_g1_i1:255-3197(-)